MPIMRPHLCRLPRGTPGARHVCEACRARFLYRPVLSREIGRVIMLWVKEA